MILQMIEDIVDIGSIADESSEVTAILSADKLNKGFTGFAPPSQPER